MVENDFIEYGIMPKYLPEIYKNAQIHILR
jgi:hypothetical protein